MVDFPTKRRWIRTCQECLKKHFTRPPNVTNDRWREFKCRGCGSEALDYGSWEPTEEEEQDE